MFAPKLYFDHQHALGNVEVKNNVN